MKQKPFTKLQAIALFANAILGAKTGETQPPVVKYFCPWGAGTWLISEAEIQGEEIILFGLCDLGFGTPEIGSVLLSELESLKGPFGMTIERDIHFTSDKSLSAYADEARANGRIMA